MEEIFLSLQNTADCKLMHLKENAVTPVLVPNATVWSKMYCYAPNAQKPTQTLILVLIVQEQDAYCLCDKRAHEIHSWSEGR